MKKLQKREKVLLMVLIILLIILLPFVFLIYPAMQSNNAKQLTYQDLRAAQTEMQTKLATKPALEENLKQLQKTYEENTALIPSPMKNYDIHYFISGLCTNAGVTLDSLSIGDYQSVQSETEGGQKKDTLLYSSSLALSVSGTFDQSMALLNGLSGYPYVIVTDFYIDMTAPASPSVTTIKASLYAVPLPGSSEFTSVEQQQTASASASSESTAQASASPSPAAS
ncbi:MAG: type II secretion system protein GspM [Christensenella sp.]|nr:type II secretion system protein GspM [Christensenella sp.]